MCGRLHPSASTTGWCDGRTTGVTLESGEQLRAPLVDPSLTDDGATVMTMFTQYGPWR
jgi:hypothetical protein